MTESLNKETSFFENDKGIIGSIGDILPDVIKTAIAPETEIDDSQAEPRPDPEELIKEVTKIYTENEIFAAEENKFDETKIELFNNKNGKAKAKAKAKAKGKPADKPADKPLFREGFKSLWVYGWSPESTIPGGFVFTTIIWWILAFLVLRTLINHAIMFFTNPSSRHFQGRYLNLSSDALSQIGSVIGNTKFEQQFSGQDKLGWFKLVRFIGPILGLVSFTFGVIFNNDTDKSSSDTSKVKSFMKMIYFLFALIFLGIPGIISSAGYVGGPILSDVYTDLIGKSKHALYILDDKPWQKFTFLFICGIVLGFWQFFAVQVDTNYWKEKKDDQGEQTPNSPEDIEGYAGWVSSSVLLSICLVVYLFCSIASYFKPVEVSGLIAHGKATAAAAVREGKKGVGKLIDYSVTNSKTTLYVLFTVLMITGIGLLIGSSTIEDGTDSENHKKPLIISGSVLLAFSLISIIITMLYDTTQGDELLKGGKSLAKKAGIGATELIHRVPLSILMVGLILILAGIVLHLTYFFNDDDEYKTFYESGTWCVTSGILTIFILLMTDMSRTYGTLINTGRSGPYLFWTSVLFIIVGLILLAFQLIFLDISQKVPKNLRISALFIIGTGLLILWGMSMFILTKNPRRILYNKYLKKKTNKKDLLDHLLRYESEIHSPMIADSVDYSVSSSSDSSPDSSPKIFDIKPVSIELVSFLKEGQQELVYNIKGNPSTFPEERDPVWLMKSKEHNKLRDAILDKVGEQTPSDDTRIKYNNVITQLEGELDKLKGDDQDDISDLIKHALLKSIVDSSEDVEEAKEQLAKQVTAGLNIDLILAYIDSKQDDDAAQEGRPDLNKIKEEMKQDIESLIGVTNPPTPEETVRLIETYNDFKQNLYYQTRSGNQDSLMKKLFNLEETDKTLYERRKLAVQIHLIQQVVIPRIDIIVRKLEEHKKQLQPSIDTTSDDARTPLLTGA